MTEAGKVRQSFGPTATDAALPYFVCWDETGTEISDHHISAHQSQFSSKQDARSFFELKCRDPKVFVWLGELGTAVADGDPDWFHTDWSPNIELKPLRSTGSGYRWSNEQCEKFEPFKAGA